MKKKLNKKGRNYTIKLFCYNRIKIIIFLKHIIK